MDPIYVIKRPMVTEKSTWASNEQGRYVFLIDRRASKDDVKRAVESLYGVRVVGVNTQVRKGQVRRLKYGWVHERETKTATVRVAEGQTIDLL